MNKKYIIFALLFLVAGSAKIANAWDGYWGAPYAYGYGYPFGYGYPYGYGYGYPYGYSGILGGVGSIIGAAAYSSNLREARKERQARTRTQELRIARLEAEIAEMQNKKERSHAKPKKQIKSIEKE